MSGSTSPEADRSVPELRIVPTENVIPHEHHDGARLEPLVESLRADGHLLNPPVVAEIGDERYVVMDGANRVTALSALGIAHCIVQVTPYEEPFVYLSTWHHAVTGMDTATIDAAVDRLDGVSIVEADLMHAQAYLAQRDLICYYVRPDGSVRTVEGGDSLAKKIALLNSFVQVYFERGQLNRTHDTDFERLNLLYPGVSALVVFPSFEPAEVKLLAQDGEKLPPGLTRHVIQGRALRINYPLTLLEEDRSLEDKNASLLAWIQARMEERRVRFYAESTFMFDE